MDKVLEITKEYKQNIQFENYVGGFATYYEAVLKLLPKSKKSLDVGCAYGILALMMKLRGDDVTTSDMTDKFTSLRMLKDQGIKFVKSNIEKEDIKGKYDLITLTETVEHLNSNPLPAIKRIYNALNPGGHLFIATVAKEVHGETTSMNVGKKGLWNDLLNWKDIPEYKGKWKDEHTYHYDQYNLITLISEAGFKIKDLGYINGFSHYVIGEKDKYA